MKLLWLFCIVSIGFCSCRYGKTIVLKEEQKELPMALGGIYCSSPISLDDGNTGILKLQFDSLDNKIIQQYAIINSSDISKFDSIVSSDTVLYKLSNRNVLTFQISGIRPGGVIYTSEYDCTIENDSINCLIVIRHEGYYPFYQSEKYYKETK
jgi:hypothetical protein